MQPRRGEGKLTPELNRRIPRADLTDVSAPSAAAAPVGCSDVRGWIPRRVTEWTSTDVVWEAPPWGPGS
ncbi:MAG: hypothetical protein AMXMBFR64_30440 [Myxococcales bacterium]